MRILIDGVDFQDSAHLSITWSKNTQQIVTRRLIVTHDHMICPEEG